MDKAVILARGLGTRMRRADGDAGLTEAQDAAAQTGVKAMIPIDRPFLDYVLGALADAGYRQVCLVVAPEHDVLRKYYTEEIRPRRLEISFAVQVEPLGTADAVAAAEEFADRQPFLVINSDNYYPIDALRGLRDLTGPGLAAFDREGMMDGGNIPPERLAGFAVIETDANGYLVRIIEKPDPETIEALPEPICVSMNCWRFGPEIFRACRAISPSARGEIEIPDAVQYAIDRLGQRFCAPRFCAPVLDMSRRADIPSVAEALAGVEVEL